MKLCSSDNHYILLNQSGISGNILNFLRDFLSCRKQRVVLNGQYLSCDNVPQGSILRPLLFLIFPLILVLFDLGFLMGNDF